MAPADKRECPAVPDLHVDIFRPPLGAGPTLLLLALAAALAIGLYLARRRGGDERGLHLGQRLLLALLRLAGLGALAWVLAGPSIYRSSSSAVAPLPVVLLADTSASMGRRDVAGAPAGPGAMVADRSGLQSRWEAVTHFWLNPALLDQVRPWAGWRVLGFDSRLHALTLDEARALTPRGGATNLFDAVAEAAQGPPGVLVVLSDGHDTGRSQGAQVLRELRRSGWRIVAVPVGGATTGGRVSLSAFADADVLFDGQSTTIHAAIAQAGFASSARVRVDLLESGHLLDRRIVDLGRRSSATTDFAIRPAGPPEIGGTADHTYRVTAAPDAADGAGTAAGFTGAEANVPVRVLRDRIKVALFEGQPSWDTQFLARALRDDAQVDLTACYALGPRRIVVTRDGSTGAAETADAASAPTSSAALRGLDVVILGRGAERFFPGDHAQALVDFVRQRGGALVLARGKAFDTATPDGAQAESWLAAIEPVRWDQPAAGGRELQTAERESASPLLGFDTLGRMDDWLGKLPFMVASYGAGQVRPGAVVLLRQTPAEAAGASSAAAAEPALVYQNVGQGRVLAVLTEGLWQWAFLPERLRRYDAVYPILWSRIMRWLATGGQGLAGENLSVTLGRLIAAPGEPVMVTVMDKGVISDSQRPTAELIGPDGRRRTLALVQAGARSPRFTGQIEASETGDYQVLVHAAASGPGAPAHTGPQTAGFSVADHGVEMLDTSANPQTMQAMAEATDGACVPVDQPERLVEIVRQLRHAAEPDRALEYVFDRPWLFALVVLSLGVEWTLRRRWGLL